MKPIELKWIKLKWKLMHDTVMCFFFRPSRYSTKSDLHSKNEIWQCQLHLDNRKGYQNQDHMSVTVSKESNNLFKEDLWVYRSYDSTQSSDTSKSLIDYVTWCFTCAFSGFKATRTSAIRVLWTLRDFVGPHSPSKAQKCHRLSCHSMSLIAWVRKHRVPTPSPSAI